MLNEQQQYAVDLYKKGTNFFLSGMAGVGKTYVIKHIYENSINRVHVVALTGCAAHLLEDCKAKTLHSWSGIGLGVKDMELTIKSIYKNRRARSNWMSVDTLIIDEVSMLGSKLLNDLNEIAKRVRKSYKPFGGIQLILTGDFAQLPPINDSFCFNSDAWKQCISEIVYLQKIHRQTDPIFQDMLNKIRMGQWDNGVIDILKSRTNLPPPPFITKLFPTIAKVDVINNHEMDAINSPPITYKPIINIEKETSDTKKQIEKILKNLPLKETLTLKKGAKVMLIVNLSLDEGLVNGSQGTVVELDKENVTVQFVNGMRRKIGYYIWKSEEDETLQIQMLPFILCWAISIHKIQGATLDVIDVDIGNQIFESGQAYVALSRVKTLDGLYISEFNMSKIKVHPDVKTFYETL
jgi:ATP-dependent DNA helicase PIF1